MSDYLVNPNKCPCGTPQPPPKVTGDVIVQGNECFLQLFVNEVLCDTLPLKEITDKIIHPEFDPEFDMEFDAATCSLITTLEGEEYSVGLQMLLNQLQITYNPDNHSLVRTVKGQIQDIQQLNCSALEFDPALCQLTHTNEKGVAVSFFLPQDRFIYDASACALTILPAKGGAPVTFPVGVTEDMVSFGMVGDKTLEFVYKNKKCQVQLPNSIIGCRYTRATNTLEMLHCDGTVDAKQFAKASLNCNTLPDGSQVISFNDGCTPNTKLFNIPAVPVQMLDTDSVDLVGSVLSFMFGGDGNPQNLNVDICQVIATHCNATITDIYADGSFDFIDNAGNVIRYPAPANCCTYFGLNPAVLGDANPTSPAGAYPNKSDNDTAIECHPDGLSFWTCIGDAWVLNYTKTWSNNRNYHQVINTVIDPAAPPAAPNPIADKTDGDTALACYTNGWCAFTCVAGTWVLDFCKVDAEDCCHYQVEVNGNMPATDPATPPAGVTAGIAKSDDDTLHVCYDNGSCFYTCVNGAWVLDFCKRDPADCCHYHYEAGTQYNQNSPPQTFANGPATAGSDKSDGDTLHVCYTNGSCYFTCVDGVFVLDFCKPDAAPVTKEQIVAGFLPGQSLTNVQVLGVDDNGNCVAGFLPAFPDIPEIPDIAECCTYMLSSTADLEIGEPTTIVGAPATKNDADTAIQKHPNGFSTWTCTGGSWVLDWVCIFPEPAEPVIPAEIHIGFDEPVKTADGGGYKAWFNCNDGCVYYCQEDGTWLAPKGCPVPAPTLPTKEGVFDPETDKLLTEATNPFVDYECVDGTAIFTRCDGSGVQMVPTTMQRGSAGGVEQIVAGDEPRPLDATLSCHDQTLPGCGPHNVRFEYNIGYAFEANTQTSATVFFNPRFSLNGGATWINYQTGGVDAMINTGAPTVGQHGEHEFHDYVFRSLPSGDYTFCSQTVFANGAIISGGIRAFASTFRTSFPQMKCCAIPAAA